MCVYIVLGQFGDKGQSLVLSKNCSVLRLHTCVAECLEMEGIYIPLGEDRRERAFFPEDLPFSGVYVLTRMPGNSYRRRFRSGLLCSYGAFRALLTALFADSTQICSLLGRGSFLQRRQRSRPDTRRSVQCQCQPGRS